MALRATHTVAILELSQAAYDEIEKKLLEAGYDHAFERGPGSMIDMSGIGVMREPPALDPSRGDPLVDRIKDHESIYP